MENSELNTETFEPRKTLQCINTNFSLSNLDRQSFKVETKKKLLKKPTKESATRFDVVRCLVAGKFSDRDALLDVPDPDAGQVAALTRHQESPVLRPDKRKINQLESQSIRQIISNR